MSQFVTLVTKIVGIEDVEPEATLPRRLRVEVQTAGGPGSLEIMASAAVDFAERLGA